MKKLLSGVLAASFIASATMSYAYAKPTKSGESRSEKAKVESKQKVESIKTEKIITETKSSTVKPSLISIKSIKGTSNTVQNLNEKYKKFSTSTPPVIKFGKTVIPTKALTKGLKAEVLWDKDSQTLVIKNDANVIEIVSGTKITVNGQEVDLKTLPKVQGSLIPFIIEALNQKPASTDNSQTVPTGDQTTTPESSSTTVPTEGGTVPASDTQGTTSPTPTTGETSTDTNSSTENSVDNQSDTQANSTATSDNQQTTNNNTTTADNQVDTSTVVPVTQDTAQSTNTN